MRWWIASALANTEKAKRLLADGWEPFAVEGALIWFRISTGDGQLVPGYDPG